MNNAHDANNVCLCSLPGGLPAPGNPVIAPTIAPPGALGTFFATQPNFVDLSNGHRLLFRVTSFAEVTQTSARLRNLAQFQRAHGMPALVDFCMLTSVSAAEQVLFPLNVL